MTMNTLPVSKKVYADIRTRIISALAVSPGSTEVALEMVDQYLAGHTPQSQDSAATIAFAMIRSELDRALERSRRARARAAARKAAKAAEAVQPIEIKLSRQQRRAQARAALKQQKRHVIPDHRQTSYNHPHPREKLHRRDYSIP